ncbi:MAG: 60S ribosomal protein L39 [Candidatus Micrarchaeota archaeon]
MSRNKTPELKAKLAKALKQNRRMPVFVVARTDRKITYNRLTRNWRKKKLKLKGMK